MACVCLRQKSENDIPDRHNPTECGMPAWATCRVYPDSIKPQQTTGLPPADCLLAKLLNHITIIAIFCTVTQTMPMTLTEETPIYPGASQRQRTQPCFTSTQVSDSRRTCRYHQIVGRQIAEKNTRLGSTGRHSLPGTSFHGTMLLGSNGKL